MSNYAENRKARYEYDVLESFEGGLVLTGQEAKSIRAGHAKLQGAFLKLMGGELWLVGAHVSPYQKASQLDGYDPTHSRKVLVRGSELRYFAEKIQEKGLTLIPFSFYPKARRIKVAFGVCRGKKAHDKRETLKARDIARSTSRILRGQDE
ncbi:SsrA-binding protein SmpB [Patescibacteria group bacterium]|nr:SsrA-binding protein SmpB [Patescibacteria group bacterium]